MPINTSDENNILKRLQANWSFVEDGEYTAIIKDVIADDQIRDDRRPIKWTLFLEDEQVTLKKFHWVDREGGVSMLVEDVKRLGLRINPENAVDVCNSLIGSKIKIQVVNGEYQNIYFKGRL
ncbi:hypothetical protein BN1058_00547 [Paraliobacillus sp. PM-2]|uniref:hypothetical protein n=1 Tax=Paraliobacillus sp. PM-2 TaxID=1462524 RepID=UPI00061BD1B6|nr:hypothetical protein [Paraliobacillus sp. PM-2]CQR46294.1 hypothetical protein BN1058_00547 [Paraliobacillus sp. PM-2]